MVMGSKVRVRPRNLVNSMASELLNAFEPKLTEIPDALGR